MAKTIFYGRFVSTPTADRVVIQQGAVLVIDESDSSSNGAGGGRGVIRKKSWEVRSVGEALEAFGVKRQDVDIVTIQDDHGFFFPGFIGQY